MPFTEAQQQAIDHQDGPCLVLAVPGAGKTTVILARLRRLIEAGVSPRAIASLTFSRRQALDMKARYVARFGATDGLTFSTIHAFCYRILRQEAARRHRPLQLIENSDAYNKYRIVRTLYRDLTHRAMRDEDLDAFFQIDSYLKNALISYEDYRKQTGISLAHFPELQRAYRAFKNSHGLIDYDDMLWETLTLLDRDVALRTRLQTQFAYFQIDEAQDTSRLQWQLIRLFAAPQHNLFIVADDDQAIYSFRGADPELLLAFRSAYPNAKTIVMQDNYRSTRNIVRLSAGLIGKNRRRYAKVPSTQTKSSEKTRVVLVRSLEQEMEKLVAELQGDLSRGDVAILYRNNLTCFALADALERAHIPFDTQTDPFALRHHPIVRDIEDFFALAQDPTDVDAFSRIYYKLNSYLKRDFLQAIRADDPNESVWDRLLALPGTQNTFYREKIEALDHQFHTLLRLKPEQAIDTIEHLMGYGDYLNEHARRKAKSARADQRVLETCRFIAKATPQFDAFFARLDALAQHLMLAQQSETPLTLSTIHRAKGLEYETVWMVDLIQTEFPNMNAIDAELNGYPRLMEEERRLFYVGMTRAKTNLRLLGRETVNGAHVGHSQFIDEVSEQAKIKTKE